MKTIYTVFIPIKDQEQANRLKQVCVDYGLPIWEHKIAFETSFKDDCLTYSKPSRQFFIVRLSHYYDVCPEDKKTQVDENEFMELLKEHKN